MLLVAHSRNEGSRIEREQGGGKDLLVLWPIVIQYVFDQPNRGVRGNRLRCPQIAQDSQRYRAALELNHRGDCAANASGFRVFAVLRQKFEEPSDCVELEAGLSLAFERIGPAVVLLRKEGPDQRHDGAEGHPHERPHGLGLLIGERLVGEEVHLDDEQEHRHRDQSEQQAGERDPYGHKQPVRELP